MISLEGEWACIVHERDLWLCGKNTVPAEEEQRCLRPQRRPLPRIDYKGANLKGVESLAEGHALSSPKVGINETRSMTSIREKGRPQHAS